jgi:hypothetical protein
MDSEELDAVGASSWDNQLDAEPIVDGQTLPQPSRPSPSPEQSETPPALLESAVAHGIESLQDTSDTDPLNQVRTPMLPLDGPALAMAKSPVGAQEWHVQKS